MSRRNIIFLCSIVLTVLLIAIIVSQRSSPNNSNSTYLEKTGTIKSIKYSDVWEWKGPGGTGLGFGQPYVTWIEFEDGEILAVMGRYAEIEIGKTYHFTY